MTYRFAILKTLLIVFLATSSLGRPATAQTQPAPDDNETPSSKQELRDFYRDIDPLGDPLDIGPSNEITVSARFGVGEDGRSGRLFVTAEMGEGWHLYSLTQPDGPVKPSKIAVAPSPDFEVTGKFLPDRKPEVRKVEYFPMPLEEHYDKVTFSAPIRFAGGADPAAVQITGKIEGQVCHDETGCIPLDSLDTSFVAKYDSSASAEEPKAPSGQPDAKEPGAKSTGKRLNLQTIETNREKAGGSSSSSSGGFWSLFGNVNNWSLWAIAPVALIGGLILNIMPCVLPVIGLKIMGFVSQAGESRGRIFALNVSYSAGLISVFLVLAALSIVWNMVWSIPFAWGQQWTYPGFSIPMLSIVFVMALSFLGVWEIPIPGFATGTAAAELAAKEGFFGAFTKGVITTILATPCSAPFLGLAVGWCTQGRTKTPVEIVAAFAFMGLGMAVPYLIIGMNPKLIRFIPKPGEWMETLKQFLAFVLLGVVIFMFTFIPWTLRIPSLTFLFGLWMACWWIGRTPMTAPVDARLRAWLYASAAAALIGFYAFFGWIDVFDYTVYGLRGMMEARLTKKIDREVGDRLTKLETNAAENDPDVDALAAANPGGDDSDGKSKNELPWEPFTLARLESLAAQDKTVMVDFTADWCLTCKSLEQFVLNTKSVRQAVDRNGVVTLVADWTDRDPQIGRILKSLGTNRVPVLAIFPAGRPNEPIVLADGYTKATLLKRLEEAGPSAGRE